MQPLTDQPENAVQIGVQYLADAYLQRAERETARAAEMDRQNAGLQAVVAQFRDERDAAEARAEAAEAQASDLQGELDALRGETSTEPDELDADGTVPAT